MMIRVLPSIKQTLTEAGYDQVVYKYHNCWIPQTPKGYSCLITSPFGYNDLPFKAAKLAGYSEASARCGSPEKQVVMKAHLKKAFEEAGLTDEYIVAYAQAGMQCNKPINVDKDTKEITEYPDWQTRHKFFDTALELTGQKVEHKESGITNNIERLVIVRADNEVQVKEVSRPVCIQPCEVSGDGVGLGNRENDVPDFTSNVIQRADTEQSGNNIS